MQVSQSPNQIISAFSSQSNFNNYGRERTFSAQNRPRQFKFENGENTERAQYPYQRCRGRRAYRGQNRGSFSRTRSFYNRNEQRLFYNNRERCPTAFRTFCRTCASNRHTARECPQRQPAYRDGNMPSNQQ